jgi:hypothetical protein
MGIVVIECDRDGAAMLGLVTFRKDGQPAPQT